MRDRGVEALPRRFGRYELTALLGQGGMGRVYRATLSGPSGFRKEVALKVIRAREDDPTESELRVRAFIQEARVCGLLRHPNVVDVYDFGATDGQPWLAMEMIDGWPLDALLADHDLLPPTVVLDLSIQIAEGLLHAHELTDGGTLLALVHRDLKPANVLVTRQGLAKVMDFGLARATGGEDPLEVSGAVRGTPAYMSPEQAGGDELDPRSDLFSFGILLYELATGSRPFRRDNVIAQVMAIVQVEEALADPAFLAPVEARLPGLGPVLARCLRRDPSNRWASARQLLDALRALLRGQPPGPSLRSWADAVLQGDPTGAAPDTYSGLSVAAALSTRGNLTTASSPFVGREGDLAALDAVVRDGARIVTIVGAAGTGKTRFAQAWLGGQADWLDAGGAWFADLSGATDLLGVLAAVAAPLGVPLDRARGDQAALDQVGYAIAGRGRVALILDNVEQVLAPTGRAVSRWAEIASGALFLVTSRERARWAGVREVELGPMDERSAVALFVGRAQAAGARDLVADGTVRRIVQRLDHLPLAIELAAAQAGGLGPVALLQRLSERFTLLRGGSEGPGRQSTLRSAIEWSWNLLAPEEQTALAQCSVFRGTFDLAAVESVVQLDGGWALDLVESLRDKSLIHAEQVRELGGATRFRLFESIRAFAAERLEDPPAVWARHGQHYLAWGEREVARIDGPRGGLVRRALTLELDNLHAVFARHARTRPLLAARAALVMSPVLLVTGPLDGHIALIERAVALAEELDPGRDGGGLLLARLLLVRGSMRGVRAEFADGEADLRRGLAAARGEADRHLEGEALARLARLLLDRGATGEGRTLAHELRALADAVGDRLLRAEALWLLGRSQSLDPKQAEAARATLKEALGLCLDLGRNLQAAQITQTLAINAAQASRHAEATELLERSLVLHRDLGHRRGHASCLANLGLLAIQAGAHAQAWEHLSEALRMSRRLGSERNIGILEMNLGTAAVLLGRGDEALLHARDAAAHLEALGNVYYAGTAYRALGSTLVLLDRLEEAHAAYARATELLARDEGGWMVASVVGCRAALLADQDRLVEADMLLAEVEGTVEDPSGRAFLSLCRGHVELSQARAAFDGGDTEEAARQVAAVRTRLARGGFDAPIAADAAQEATNRVAALALARALARSEAERAFAPVTGSPP